MSDLCMYATSNRRGVIAEGGGRGVGRLHPILFPGLGAFPSPFLKMVIGTVSLKSCSLSHMDET